MNSCDFQGVSSGSGTEADRDVTPTSSPVWEDRPSSVSSDQELIEKEGFVDSETTEDTLAYLAETPGPFQIEVEEVGAPNDYLADPAGGQSAVDHIAETPEAPADIDMLKALGPDVKDEIKNVIGGDVSNIELTKDGVSFDVGELNVEIKAGSEISIPSIRNAFDRLIRKFANRYRLSAHRPADIYRRFSNDGDREADAQVDDRNHEIDRIRGQGGRYGELRDELEIVIQRKTIDVDTLKQIDIVEHVRHRRLDQDI